MLFFKEEKDYKNVVSGLRRELKAMGLPVASHTQMVEALAKAMGHKNWAALQVAHKSQPTAAPAAPVAAVKPKDTYDGENVDLEDDLENKPYRLFNDDGSLDLAGEGSLVTGLDLYGLEGTLDDITYCTANVNSVNREASGELDVQFSGDTEVNWDGQETRHDRRNVRLWWSENADAVPEDRCIVVPEGLDRGSNILNEEVVQEYDLPVRMELVDAAFRYLNDKGLADQALLEMGHDGDFFGDEFYDNANQLRNSGKRKASALGLAQCAAGFCMHVGEFKVLLKRLTDAKQPALF